MSFKLLIALIITAALGAPVGYVYYNAQLSSDNWIHTGNGLTSWKDGGAHAVPGPLAGAGLPFVAIGYGVYWLFRRRRNTQ